MGGGTVTLAQLVWPPRWRTSGPHPATPATAPPAAHDAVKAFYATLPDHLPHAVDNRPTFLPLEAAILFVADHPGWRLRYLQGRWRVISGPRAVT